MFNCKLLLLNLTIFQVTITGSNVAVMTTANLELWVDLRLKMAVGAPVISVKLGNLDNPEGVLLAPSLRYLDLIQSGSCDLVVKDSITNITFMRAVLKQVNDNVKVNLCTTIGI